MPNILDTFYIDVNYDAAQAGVFTLIDQEIVPPLPPIEGYFLFLNGTPFGLLNSTLLPPILSLL